MSILSVIGPIAYSWRNISIPHFVFGSSVTLYSYWIIVLSLQQVSISTRNYPILHLIILSTKSTRYQKMKINLRLLHNTGKTCSFKNSHNLEIWIFCFVFLSGGTTKICRTVGFLPDSGRIPVLERRTTLLTMKEAIFRRNTKTAPFYLYQGHRY